MRNNRVTDMKEKVENRNPKSGTSNSILQRFLLRRQQLPDTGLAQFEQVGNRVDYSVFRLTFLERTNQRKLLAGE